jgi:hypothetical protein
MLACFETKKKTKTMLYDNTLMQSNITEKSASKFEKHTHCTLLK